MQTYPPAMVPWIHIVVWYCNTKPNTRKDCNLGDEGGKEEACEEGRYNYRGEGWGEGA